MARLVVRESQGAGAKCTRSQLFSLCQRLVAVSANLPEEVLEEHAQVFLDALACGITLPEGSRILDRQAL
jgi:hypothetical protein